MALFLMKIANTYDSAYTFHIVKSNNINYRYSSSIARNIIPQFISF